MTGEGLRDRRYRITLLVGAVLLVVFAILGISLGSIPISTAHVIEILGSPLWGEGETEVRAVDRNIILLVRLPRVALAAVVGAMLALAGAQIQGLFRNPLAAPGIIGTSQGAALGAVLALSTGLAIHSAVYVPVFAFCGAFLALLILSALAYSDERSSVAMLLLGGVALNFLLSSAISLIISFSWKKFDIATGILTWLMGGLEGSSWSQAGMAVPCLIVGYAFSRRFARDLDLMLEGEESARSLGVATERVKYSVLFITALLTGGAVAVSGVVSFVGLIVPHFMRLILGPSHRRLNAASAITGAWFLIGADLVARTLIRPEELRLGIVTALIGAPFFLYLLVRQREELEVL